MSVPYPVRFVSASLTRRRRRQTLKTLLLAGCIGIGSAQAYGLLRTEEIVWNLFAGTPPEPLKSLETIVAGEEWEMHDETPRGLPLSVELPLEQGGSISTALAEAGVSSEEVENVATVVQPLVESKGWRGDKHLSVRFEKGQHDDGSLMVNQITFPLNLTTTLEVTRTPDDAFVARTIVAPLEKRLARVGGNIRGSFYETSEALGLPAKHINELIAAFSYDVDFQRDIHPGDTLDVLVEKMTTEQGITATVGDIVYAELNLGNERIALYRYVDKDGQVDYYNAKGESIRKALLRTPINGARISSGYGMRNHPILGYSKMHRGVDFAAATGTPIYAAGDGVVDYIGRNGGYGNYLRINHNGRYATAYGHISRFATGLKPGARVKQGQVIAYVGSTGLSTGPHLHYEVLVNNEQVNPAGVKFKNGRTLEGRELTQFRRNVERVAAQLDKTPRGTSVAMADNKGENAVMR